MTSRSEPTQGNSRGRGNRNGDRATGERVQVGLFSAYLLWLIGGPLGLHHAYLGRPRQALLWYSTLALWGWGWCRDFFRMPHYVHLANSDPTDPVVQIRETTMKVLGGVPPLSLTRLVAMCFFGWYFGKIASCAVVVAGGAGWVYHALRAVGAAIGIGLVANAGEETLEGHFGGERSKGGGLWQESSLLRACLLGSAVGVPSLAGSIQAIRSRSYRRSMGPQRGVASRLARHAAWCGAFSAFLFLAAFNHGGINVNGRPVYFREAARNAYNSDFWQTFNFTEFGESFGQGGGRGGRPGDSGEYLKRAFDLGGERRARRILDLGPRATHVEVKSAYKRLALRYHPDKMRGDAGEDEIEDAKRKFIEIQEAYEILNKLEQSKKPRVRKEADED